MSMDDEVKRARKRSLSPRDHRHDLKRHHRRRSPDSGRKHIALPYGQEVLVKQDLDKYEAIFASYLETQKHLDITKLDRDQVYGRWKAFVKKWNAGQLAQGWYEPAMQERIAQRQAESKTDLVRSKRAVEPADGDDGEPSDDSDDYGPSIRPSSSTFTPQGPTPATLQDLTYKREMDLEQRNAERDLHQKERKLEKQAQQERLEELVPRADPGSIERKREKKQETTSSNRAFADAKDSGALEVADADLLGDDDVDAYKAKIRAAARQKNERELRREEVLRARAAERAERFAEHTAKEEKTMATLRALAQQRFG